MPLEYERRRNAIVASAIFLIALAVRLVYLVQIVPVPFFRSPIGDGRAYWEWAGRIAAGDWLGHGVFYQAPLYPYLLGAARVLGASPPAIYVAQSLLNACSCVLLYFTARRLFSKGAGVIAALMLAFYPTAILFDGVLQKEALAIFFITSLLFLTARANERPSRAVWLGTGAALGFLALTRENLLLFLPLVLVWAVLLLRRHPREKWFAWGGMLAIGLALTLLPVGFRNLFVGGQFALTTSQMGPNFYIGNSPSADGTYVPLRPTRGDPHYEQSDAKDLAEKASGRLLSPNEVSAYWMGRAWSFIHSQPSKWFRLTAKKAGLFLNAKEVPDAEDPLFYGRWSPLLRILGMIWNFGVLLPLAAAGAVLCWPRRRDLWLLYVLAAAIALGVTLFFIFARYRLPIVPILILFAAAAPILVLDAFRAGKRRLLAVAAAAAVLSIAVSQLPLYPRLTKDANSVYNWAYLLREQGKTDEAAERYAEAARLDPSLPQAHFNLANIRSHQGRTDEAVREYHEAIRIFPGYSDAWNNLGILLVRVGRFPEGAEAFAKAVEADPQNANAIRNAQRALEVARQGGDVALAMRLERALTRR